MFPCLVYNGLHIVCVAHRIRTKWLEFEKEEHLQAGALAPAFSGIPFSCKQKMFADRSTQSCTRFENLIMSMYCRPFDFVMSDYGFSGN